jgi:hypothetical protein
MKTLKQFEKSLEDKFNLKTLKDVKCSPEVKKELRKYAQEWIKWEKQHMKDWDNDKEHTSFHNGSIRVLREFFNIKAKRV